MKKPYKILDSRTVAQNPWYTLRQDDIALPDGSQIVYNVLNKADAVWVVPVLEDGRVVLINQYRHPVDAWCLEVPAGGIAPGANPEDVARNELREEIGGTASQLEFLGTTWTMNGIGDEMAYIYLAKNVTLASTHHEPTEFIELKIVSATDAINMARRGDIKDVTSAFGILLCESYLLSLSS